MGMEIDILENGKKTINKELTSSPQNIQNLNVLPSIEDQIKSSATEYIPNTDLNLYPQDLINLPATNPTTFYQDNIEYNQNIFPEENVIDAQTYPVSNIQPEIDIGENYPVENIETTPGTYLENNDINQYIEEAAPISTPLDELGQIFSNTKDKIVSFKDTAQTVISNPIVYNIAKNQVQNQAQNLYQSATNKVQNLYQSATNQVSNKVQNLYQSATNQVSNQAQNLYQSAANTIGSYSITNPIGALATQSITSYVGQKINENVIDTFQNEYNNLEVTATKYLSPDAVTNALSTGVKSTVGNKINDVKESIKQKTSFFPTPLEHLENVIHTKYADKLNFLGINNAKTEEKNTVTTPGYTTPYENETILNGRPVKIIKIEDEENIQFCPDSISSFCKILFA